MGIDETDNRILSVLLENSKLSYRQIAKKVNVSVVTVMNRVKKLEKEEIIRSYTTVLNYTKLGYDVPVLVEIKVVHGRDAVVYNKLMKHPNISAVYFITGEFDVAVIARFKNRAELRKFVENLPDKENIEKTNTKLILRVVKEGSLRLEPYKF
jgi:Lrp/AsnC family transcriptional regulator, regulator for asnA, asnC and gidA